MLVYFRKLFYDIGELQMRDVLLNQRDAGLGALYATASVEGYAHRLLDILDKGQSHHACLTNMITCQLCHQYQCC